MAESPNPQTPENTEKYSAPAEAGMSEKDNNTLMGVLAYIGPFVVIPFLTAKEDPFVKFHIKQGVVLLGIEIAVWILSSMLWTLWPLFQIVNLGVLVLIIMGIVNVIQGEKKELPLVGQFSKYVTF